MLFSLLEIEVVLVQGGVALWRDQLLELFRSLTHQITVDQKTLLHDPKLTRVRRIRTSSEKTN
jgi:hypothetical protein